MNQVQKQIEKTRAELEAVKLRRKRRSDADAKDRAELYRLEHDLERLNAKSMIGCQVVLNPNTSIQNTELRKLRGVLATVESVGRKYIHIEFPGGVFWNLPFRYVVLATPEAAQQDDGVLDGVADMLNGVTA